MVVLEYGLVLKVEVVVKVEVKVEGFVLKLGKQMLVLEYRSKFQ